MKTLKPRAWRALRVVLLGGLSAAVLITAVFALRAREEVVPAWVTQQPLPVGAKIRESDPRLVMVPPAAVPEGALRPDGDFDDAPAARFIPERSVLTEADLVGSDRATPLAPGEVLLNLSVPATAGAELQPGEVVDLWGQGSGCGDFYCPPELLAANARVVQVSAVDAGSWSPETHSAVSVILDEANIGLVLMAESDESLNFVLRSVADAEYPPESRAQ